MKAEIEKAAGAWWEKNGLMLPESDDELDVKQNMADFALSQIRAQIRRDAEIVKSMYLAAGRAELVEAILAQLEEDP